MQAVCNCGREFTICFASERYVKIAANIPKSAGFNDLVNSEKKVNSIAYYHAMAI